MKMPPSFWSSYKEATGLSLEEMDEIAKQVGFTLDSPFTAEQAARFESECEQAEIRKLQTPLKP